MYTILGPKCSIYYSVLSLWGVIMLALMAIFFKIRTPLLVEDTTLNMTAWAQNNYPRELVEQAYDDAAANCGIACGLYLLVFIFSFVQLILNMMQSAPNISTTTT